MQRRILTHQEEQAYRLCSDDFRGLSQEQAAKKMGISQKTVSRLLERVARKCPSLPPVRTPRPKTVQFVEGKDNQIKEIF